jgi:hypothetical protein
LLNRHIAVILFLLWCPVALAQVQPATIQLVDSAGTTVGPVLNVTASAGLAKVPLIIDGHVTILGFSPRASSPLIIVTDRGFEGVFFASPDCTGQGFAAQYLGPNQEFLEPQAIGGPNYTFYAGPHVAPMSLASNSKLGAGHGCSMESFTFTDQVAPVSAVRDLAPPWVPPFRLQFIDAPAPNSVPAVSPWGLAFLIAALATIGIVLMRRRSAGIR